MKQGAEIYKNLFANTGICKEVENQNKLYNSGANRRTSSIMHKSFD